ncbi:hypothetical protein DYB32_009245, partial [Aphanomyces invadans]
FDTGLDPDSARRHFRHVDDIINWTDEPVLRDSDGHGSFVAGVVGSVHRACPGIAPDASLVSFRVFTTSSASYTSWLLDALNYAMYLGVDVLNFSFGGPDFHDTPFMDKIHECAASGIVVVSAVGNGGPQYGTLTNPADQIDVFGIGGLGSTPSMHIYEQGAGSLDVNAASGDTGAAATSTGDHAHTNFGDFFHRLVVQHKLYVEVLTTDYSCVDDLSVYGLLLVVDPEEPWFPTEVALVHAAMRSSDLSMFVIADWYSPTVLTSMSFWDANTLSTWLPVTGGANIPAINTFLAAFRIRLSHRAWSNPGIMYLSGSAIVDLPDLGFVLWANVTQDSTGPTGLSPRRIASFESVKSANNAAVPPNDSQKMAVAALVPLQGANAGRSDAKATCEGWIDGLIEYALRGKLPVGVEAVNNLHVREDVDHDAADIRAQTLLAKYSKVLGHAPACPNVAFG